MIGKQFEYDAMAECEKKLWWYKCLHELTTKKIKEATNKSAKILDAGCGTGGMMTHLINQGFTNTTGFDLSTDAINHATKNSALNVRLLNILESDKAYAVDSFDVIISNDILCLLGEYEDKLAFDKLVSLLKPGGLLLMNLPAGKFFKGTHDTTLGVNRRYSKHSIQKLTKNSNVELREVFHWPFVLSPLIFLLRLFQRGKLLFNKNKQYRSDVRLPHALLNSVFYKLTRFENKTMGFKPWGSSIFVTIVKLQPS